MASEALNHLVKPPRILIVDDDPGQRSLLDSFLRSQGFETVAGRFGRSSPSKRFAPEDFSMMISDVRMPGISGLETLRRRARSMRSCRSCW